MKKQIRSIFVFALVLACSYASTAQSGKQTVTLEDLWAKGTFRGKGVSGLKSMKDGLHYTAFDLSEGNRALAKYEYKTGKNVGTIFLLNDLKPEGKDKALDPDNYVFSPDEKKMLIATETEQIYRHSSREEYYVLDIATKKLSRLSTGGKQRYASFSPDGSKVAFVRENNIFVTDLASGKEEQITPDGQFNKIINGSTDWVYEEEFAFDQAFFWSPDGKRIAFYRFDESAVKEFSMNEYGALYPTEYRFKYPKAGEKNSEVRILMYELGILVQRKTSMSRALPGLRIRLCCASSA
jgi:dipeptidyl-peptidase-4